MHSDYVFIKTVEADFMKDFKRGGLTSMVNRLKSLYIHTYTHTYIHTYIGQSTSLLIYVKNQSI